MTTKLYIKVDNANSTVKDVAADEWTITTDAYFPRVGENMTHVVYADNGQYHLQVTVIRIMAFTQAKIDHIVITVVVDEQDFIGYESDDIAEQLV